MKTPLQILIDAKALIDSPEKWTRDADSRDSEGMEIGVFSCMAACFCAYGAIERAADAKGNAYVARAFLRDVIPEHYDRRIESWNDAPERTHAEVLAAFDTAIALARQAEAQP